jgi:hypothetical protein
VRVHEYFLRDSIEEAEIQIDDQAVARKDPFFAERR